MEFQLPIAISSPPVLLSYPERIMLMGSCFTEHLGEKLSALKFNTLENPNGIVFDPLSVARSLVSCIRNQDFSGRIFFFIMNSGEVVNTIVFFQALKKARCWKRSTVRVMKRMPF